MAEGGKKPGLALYLRLLKYLGPYQWYFALSLIGFVIFASSQPMLAKYFEVVITAIEAKDAEARWMLGGAAIAIFLVRGIGYFIGNYFNEYIGISVVRDLKGAAFRHLLYLPSTYFDGHNHGDLLHRLNNAATMVQKAVTDALKILIREGLTVVFLLGYVFYLNWQMSLIFVLLAPFLALTVSYTSKRFRKIAKKNEENLGEQMQVAKEVISNDRVVKVYCGQEHEGERYATALQKSHKNQLKIRKIAAIFTPFTQLIVAAAVAGIVFLLLSPSTLAQYTTGELIGYLTAIALLPKPFRQLSGVNALIQRGLVGAEIVFDILDQKAEADAGSYEASTIDGDIKVSHLTFAYPGSDKTILKDISLHISPGETVALVGESGSGKSTLASLIARYYVVEDGAMFVDGRDINSYQLKSLRSHIAFVNQNPFLFNDSVYNNIAYAAGDEVAERDVQNAIELSHAKEFVDELPIGMETLVGDDGNLLSGGQRQRISIARAFLKQSSILILDEATSALDNESENAIKRAIESISEKRTTLIIAHRLSTIEKADRVLVMRNGEIVEQGSHSDLLAEGGYYASLYQSEFRE